MIPVVVYWGPHVTPPTEPVWHQKGVRLVAGRQSIGWRSRLEEARLDVDEIDRLAARVRQWRVEQEARTVGTAVESRLGRAVRLGRLSTGLTVLMVVLLPLSRVSGPVGDSINALFWLGGGTLALVVLLMPLFAGVASAAFVWLARQLDPEIRWFPRLGPFGAWIGGFAGLLLAT